MNRGGGLPIPWGENEYVKFLTNGVETVAARRLCRSQVDLRTPRSWLYLTYRLVEDGADE